MGKTADAVIAIARREIGTVEKPKNSNNVKYNTWYYKQEVYDGKNGGKYPWCMAFVQWVFNEAGFPLPYKTASCSALLNWYKTNAPELVHSEPQRGDIVIYKGHTGIFEKIGPDPKYMYVIEGNTAVGNDDNGGAVMERYRKVNAALAFITPFKEDTSSGADAPPSPQGEGLKAERYDSLEEIPVWARDDISELIASGALKGKSGKLDLSEDMLRVLIIVKRMTEMGR